MARLVVSMNLSLDGYIDAGADDDGSWLSIDEEVHVAFNQLAAGASVFLYGRKVYEVMPPYWPDAAADTTKPAHEREYGRIWVEKTQGGRFLYARRVAVGHSRGAGRGAH